MGTTDGAARRARRKLASLPATQEAGGGVFAQAGAPSNFARLALLENARGRKRSADARYGGVNGG
jgi:hypothetical protein